MSINVEHLENGTKNYVISNDTQKGVYNITYNGSSTSSETVKLEYKFIDERDRVNFSVNKTNFSDYCSINSVKIRFKAVDISGGPSILFELKKETSSNGDNTGEIISYSKSVAEDIYEIDITDLYNNTALTDVMYFSIRPMNGTSNFYTLSSLTPPEVVYNVIDNNQGFLGQDYITGNAGRALNYSINVRNGQPFFTKPLISLGGNLMPINLGLVFNGTHINEAWFSGMPHGWKTNYHQKIISNTDGTKTYVDSQGLEHIFEKALNSNTVYFDTAGTGLILGINSDYTYTIDDGYKNYLYFDSSGKLYEIRHVVGINAISTTINYDGNNRIKTITDGMERTYEFTYNTSDIKINGPGISEIVLNLYNNQLVEVTECDERYSEYTYVNNRLSKALSDSGEKTLFTYDSNQRVLRVEEYLTNQQVSPLNTSELFYKIGHTIVKNKKGVYFAYIFNEEGEKQYSYEVFTDDEVIFTTKSTEDFTNFRNLINKNKYFSILNVKSQSQIETINICSSNGNISVEEGDTCLCFISCYIEDSEIATIDGPIKLQIMQKDAILSEFEIAREFAVKQRFNVLFKCISNDEIKINFINSTTRDIFVHYPSIYIYKIEKNESYECINKNLGGTLKFNASGNQWYEFPKNNTIKYTDSSGVHNYDKSMDFIDLVETQKNYSLYPNWCNVWYNKKRGLIVGATNVYLKNGSVSCKIEEMLAAKVYVDKNGYSFSYNDYSTVSSNTSQLMYRYSCALQGDAYAETYQLIDIYFRCLEENDINNVKTTYSYDAYGNILSIIRSYNSEKFKTTYQYENYKYLINSTNYLGDKTLVEEYEYDYNTGNITKIIRPNDIEINYEYDSNTNNLKSVYMLENGVKVGNDITYNLNKVSTLKYGNFGYGFDYMNNMLNGIKILKGNSSVPYYQYNYELTNTQDRVIGENANEYETTKVFDKYGNLISIIITDPSDNNKYLYYCYSNQEVATTSSGTLTGNESEYNISNSKTNNSKLRFIRCNDFETDYFHYDDFGFLKEKFSETYNQYFKSEYTYDEFERISSKKILSTNNDNNPFEINYSYLYKEINGFKTNVLNGVDGSVKWSYDNTSTNKYNYSADFCKYFDLDNFNRVVKETLEMGSYILIKEYEYEKSSSNIASTLLKKITYKKGSTTLGTIEYTYDEAGNIKTILDTVTKIPNSSSGGSLELGNKPSLPTITTYTNNEVSYEYDKLGRIIRENNKIRNETRKWSYDSFGNILKVEIGKHTTGNFTPLTTKNFVYSPEYPDRLTSYDNMQITYDSMGQIKTYGSKTFEWKNNKLQSVKQNNSSIVTCNYNLLGKRTHKSSNQYYCRYTYDGDKLISEDRTIISTGETVYLYYLYSNDEIIGFIYKDKDYYFTKNPQGDIINLIHNNVVYATYVYDAWGNCTIYSSSGSIDSSTTSVGYINPFRYRGYYYDVETGLFWCNSRYYNPEWGRWISPDSIEYLDPSSINGLNLYAYCGNDPVNKYDPSGCFAISTFLIGLAVSAVVGWGLSEIFGAQIAGGIGTVTGGATAISTGISLCAFGPWGIAAGVVLMLVGGATIAFGANEIVDGATGTNYIQEWTGWSDNLYDGLYIGLNVASAVGSIAGNIGMKIASNNILNNIVKNPQSVQNYKLWQMKTYGRYTTQYVSGTLQKGSHIGQGYTLTNIGGGPKGYIQWHPGSRHHFGGATYWKVTSALGGTWRGLYLF